MTEIGWVFSDFICFIAWERKLVSRGVAAGSKNYNITDNMLTLLELCATHESLFSGSPERSVAVLLDIIWFFSRINLKGRILWWRLIVGFILFWFEPILWLFYKFEWREDLNFWNFAYGILPKTESVCLPYNCKSDMVDLGRSFRI